MDVAFELACAVLTESDFGFEPRECEGLAGGHGISSASCGKSATSRLLLLSR
jgi:hypothetical protein